MLNYKNCFLAISIINFFIVQTINLNANEHKQTNHQSFNAEHTKNQEYMEQYSYESNSKKQSQEITNSELSSQILKKQLLDLKNMYNKYDKNIKKMNNMDTVNFELSEESEEFIFQHPFSSTFLIQMRIYIKINDIYMISTDLDSITPVKIEIREKQSKRLIKQNIFYYIGAVELNSEASKQYSIKIWSTGIFKMIQLKVPKKIPQAISFLSQFTSIQDLKLIKQGTSRRLKDIEQINALDFMNKLQYEKTMVKFSLFNFLEMYILIFLTVVQLLMIKNQIRNATIK